MATASYSSKPVKPERALPAKSNLQIGPKRTGAHRLLWNFPPPGDSEVLITGQVSAEPCTSGGCQA